MRSLGLLALLLTGCAAVPAAPAAPPSPEPVVLLVKVEARGGLCVTGTTCESSITVLSDGAWTRVVNGARQTGTLTGGRVAQLADAVDRTELADAPAFTGTCPVAYDGQEQLISWLAEGKQITVASCEQEFDPADPLVAAAAELSAELA
jgi:hypothetical protein